MSFEPGGRADKYGNEYENRYLAKLLLRLVKEEITYVVVEPLGEFSDSVEFVAGLEDGSVHYYQCKGSNAERNSWTLSDLERYNVLNRARKIIETGGSKYYHFISPLKYNELDELCKRARTNSSADEFINSQLTNSTIRKLYDNCAKVLNLDSETPEGREYLRTVLAHCFFEVSGYDSEAEWNLNEYIGTVFTGNPAHVCTLLSQFANKSGKFGVRITAHDVVDYLKTCSISVRDYKCDETVLHRITVLNSDHWDTYTAISDTLIPRAETSKIISAVQNTDSVILHGKAGSGKSGCLEETIEYLENSHTLYLAIKLDKHVPSGSADEYGKRLGLPQSPVYCLAILAAGQPCVLILDQIDALRWTANHSSDALSVCKELIHQADAINRNENGKLSIVFASRTFDLENDRGLKGLFSTSQENQGLKWVSVEVGLFNTSQVAGIVGPEYNRLSSRVKQLLHTPSSLYVWQKLSDTSRGNDFPSVFSLMSEWWRQIQNQCVNAADTKDVIACRDRLVTYMEQRSTFILPISLFSDYQKIIEIFESNGLIRKNQNTGAVSFTHQSFLDYFVAVDTIEKVYSGESLVNLIGSPDDQTPVVRYRLLSVLQALIENDQELFVEQAAGIVNSFTVRYYFKCTVFEVAGQCNTPSAALISFIQTHFNESEWAEYINQVVLYRHPVYVQHFIEQYEYELSDTVLSLIGSVSDICPDYVADFLTPFAFKTSEQDEKIFRALRHNAVDDSDRMFTLRKELLRRNPTLFNIFFDFSELIKAGSTRTIDLFEIVLESWKSLKGQHNLYITKEDFLEEYIKRYYRLITERLFEKICEVTKTIQHRSSSYHDCDFGEWVRRAYNTSSAREIVEIVKCAMGVYAQFEPEIMIDWIKRIQHPTSVVGHELIMHGLNSLPDNCGDFVISWLLDDFDNRILVFTENESDYLCYTKKIIQKFSTHCDMLPFSKLEQKVLWWKESTAKMVQTYKSRLSVNRTHKYEPVYYAYWGHLQKELLPCMDNSRLSPYAKDLIGVVNWNSWIHIPHFHSGILVGSAKSVVSPIYEHPDRLCDNTWLQIISTPNVKVNNTKLDDYKGSYYIEASPEAFAASLGEQAKKEPERFANLCLIFPPNCYSGYVTNVLYALDDGSLAKRIPFKTVCNVVRRYIHTTNSNILIALARVIEAYAAFDWPEDVLDIIENVITNHSDSDEPQYPVTNYEDPGHKTIQSLMENALNCVRGCNISAVAAILREHPELSNRFMKAISQICMDRDAIVRFAAVQCLKTYYDIDNEFSYKLIKLLLNADLRILGAPGCWEILSSEYRKHKVYIRGKIVEASMSEINDLSECAASMLCVVAVNYNDQIAMRELKSNRFSKSQMRKICVQAVHSFEPEEFHERSKEILLHIIECEEDDIPELGQLFFDNCVRVQRDIDFLTQLMSSRQSSHLLHPFLEYLYESGEDICAYASVIEAIGKNLAQALSGYNGIFVSENLVKCVVRLYDRGKSDPQIKKICLDLWDSLFKCDFKKMKPLSDMIDSFE